MNKKSNLLYLLAGLFLVLFLTAASSTETNNNKQYCYALIAPIEEGNNGSSRIIKSDCFDNFADSISAATNGRVLLNHFARPDEVTNELLNSNNGLSSLSSQVVIGIDWDSTNFAGSSYTWVVSGSGCSISTHEGIQTAITSIITRIQIMEDHRLYAIPNVLQWGLLIMRLLRRNGLILLSRSKYENISC